MGEFDPLSGFWHLELAITPARQLLVGLAGGLGARVQVWRQAHLASPRQLAWLLPPEQVAVVLRITRRSRRRCARCCSAGRAAQVVEEPWPLAGVDFGSVTICSEGHLKWSPREWEGVSPDGGSGFES